MTEQDVYIDAIINFIQIRLRNYQETDSLIERLKPYLESENLYQVKAFLRELYYRCDNTASMIDFVRYVSDQVEN